jgi:hypothetical protein
MEEPKLPDSERRDIDESLADVPPTPLGFEAEPEPASWFGKGLLLLGVAGAGVFVLISGSMTTCMGATRSAKLKWQERELEIEQAVRDANIELDAHR